MKQQRILMLSAGDERDTRRRVLAHRPALEAAGYRVEIRHAPDPASPGVAGRLLRLTDRIRDLYGDVREDLLFVHRKLYAPAWAPRLRRSPRPVVFDLDDTLDRPGAGAGASKRRRARARFEATMEAADLVLCGDDDLAARLPHDRYEILPTPIDTRRFAPQHVVAPRQPTLGWVGGAEALGQLERLGGVLAELTRQHPDLKLIVVSARQPRLPGVTVEFRPEAGADEVQRFSGIGVGLLPAAREDEAHRDWATNVLRFLALGIPTVASAVAPGREAIVHGECGFLADGEEEWLAALEALLSKPTLRKKFAALGRSAVESRFAVEVISDRLIEIFAVLMHEGPRGYWDATTGL